MRSLFIWRFSVWKVRVGASISPWIARILFVSLEVNLFYFVCLCLTMYFSTLVVPSGFLYKGR